MPVTSPKVDKLPEPRGPHAAWAHCYPVLAGSWSLSEHAALPNGLFFFGVGLVKQSDWRLLPAIPMAFLLPLRWKHSWSFASSLKACRNRLTASLSIFWPAKSCVAAAFCEKSSCAVPKTLLKTGEKTSVEIRQKSDKYEPQRREAA